MSWLGPSVNLVMRFSIEFDRSSLSAGGFVLPRLKPIWPVNQRIGRVVPSENHPIGNADWSQK